MLDSSPRNELGKGILDPAQEALLLAQGYTYAQAVMLLAQGYTYARRVFYDDGKFFLNLAKSPISEIVASLKLSLLNTTIVCQK